MSELPASGDMPATTPEAQPRQELDLIPKVVYPHVMTPGRKHLVEVNLNWKNNVSDNPLEWPFLEEELAYTCSLVDSWGRITVYAVNDASVIIHRFGGSYGPAEFIAIPHADITSSFDHYLQLTFFNPHGIPLYSHDLALTISSPERPAGSPPITIIPGSVLPSSDEF